MRSTVTAGTIVDLDASVNADDGKTYYHPEFIFTAQDGKSYTVVSSTGYTNAPFEKGQTITVRYDKSNPGSAVVNTFEQLWFTPMAAGMLGIIFTATGRWLKSREKRKALAQVGI